MKPHRLLMYLLDLGYSAERFLSEGNSQGARIRVFTLSDMNKIQSEAYQKVEDIHGVADAKATEFCSRLYNQSTNAVAFHEFTRTMQYYKFTIAENTTLVLSTNSDLFKYLRGMSPDDGVESTRLSAENRCA